MRLSLHAPSRAAMRLTAATAVLAVAVTGALVTPADAAVTRTESGDRTTSAPAPTSISIRALKRRVEPGGSARIAGNLRTPDVDPGGRAVTLEARAEGAAEFTPIAAVLAGEKGALRSTVTPETDTRYRWRYDGAADAEPETSGVVIVQVKQKQDGNPKRLGTTLSVRAADGVADRKGEVVSGLLRSRNTELPDRKVQLIARSHGQNQWRFVDAERTTREGRVSFRVTPAQRTAYRLVFQGTRVFRPTTSGVVRVGVRPRVSAEATPRFIDAGQSSQISGVVRFEGATVSGAVVDLLARATRKGSRFATVATATTAADGTVSFAVTPGVSSTYRLKARQADARPIGTSGPVEVTVRSASSLSIRGKDAASGYVVSGALRGGGHPIRGALVTLTAAAPGSSEYTAAGTARTGRSGAVRFVRSEATGTSYRLVFDGGQRYTGSTSGVVVD